MRVNIRFESPQKLNIFFFRVSELIALVSVSTTLFLFIQTRDLSHRLHEIQDPNLDLSAFGAKIDSGKSGGRSIEDITKPKSHLSRELSNEKVKVNKIESWCKKSSMIFKNNFS